MKVITVNELKRGVGEGSVWRNDIGKTREPREKPKKIPTLFTTNATSHSEQQSWQAKALRQDGK